MQDQARHLNAMDGWMDGWMERWIDQCELKPVRLPSDADASYVYVSSKKSYIPRSLLVLLLFLLPFFFFFFFLRYLSLAVLGLLWVELFAIRYRLLRASESRDKAVISMMRKIYELSHSSILRSLIQDIHAHA